MNRSVRKCILALLLFPDEIYNKGELFKLRLLLFRIVMLALSLRFMIWVYLRKSPSFCVVYSCWLVCNLYLGCGRFVSYHGLVVITLIDNQAKLTQNIWTRGVSLRLLAAALDTKLRAMSLQILYTVLGQFKNGMWNM